MRLLILEDDSNFARTLAEALQLLDDRYEVRIAERLSEALSLAADWSPNVALVDLDLPDASDCDSARALREIDPGLPIVALTGRDFESVGIALIRMGVQDFLQKGDASMRGVHHAIQLAVERQRRESELRERAGRDPLTGALNRLEFEQALVRATSHAARTGHPGALMFIDVDDLKVINDTHGHAAGDAVLEEFARRLAESGRSGDTVGRLGGDEFALILEGMKRHDDARSAARKVHRMAHFEMNLDAGTVIRVSASIGVVTFSDQRRTPECLLRQADEAMYRAKRQTGKNAVVFHAPGAGSDP